MPVVVVVVVEIFVVVATDAAGTTAVVFILEFSFLVRARATIILLSTAKKYFQIGNTE